MAESALLYQLKSKGFSGCTMSSRTDNFPVISATKLPLRHRHLPNAYVQLKLADVHLKTKVVDRSQNPTWDETFDMCAIPSRAQSIRVY